MVVLAGSGIGVDHQEDEAEGEGCSKQETQLADRCHEGGGSGESAGSKKKGEEDE
jgi:hypothetical protein